jgi:predicted nucleotidyltransferase component of viral defense system
LIPSRSLSILANRLAAGGGRRIPERVLERDYCLAWFLVGLSRSRLCRQLAFKGGTALKRCHFADYRFSEDLDFTLLEPLDLTSILAALEPIFRDVADASAVELRFAGPDRHSHENSYTLMLGYEGPLPAQDSRVKVDITRRERLTSPLEMRPVLRGYGEYADLPQTSRLQTYSLVEIAAEKIVALLDRARVEPRDLYDLWFLLNEGGVDAGDLLAPVTEKLVFRGRDLDECAAVLREKEKRLARVWTLRLSAQMVWLPEFAGVFRAVRRQLRQAHLAK